MDKVVSILIPVYNNLHYTKECISSIFETTKVRVELIIIDNGSIDGTDEFLREIEQKLPKNITGFNVIKNEENKGVVFAFNQGLKSFTGDYLLLQNNDCIMGSGWLEEILKVANNNEEIGIFAPLSNLFSGKTHSHPQLIYPDYKNSKEMNEFVEKLKENELAFTEASFVFGHSMLISRKVADIVGDFDSRYGIGYCEEVDYCKRAKEKGFLIGVANRAYVHHYGNKTFDLMNLNHENLKNKNKEIFLKKWGEEYDKGI